MVDAYARYAQICFELFGDRVLQQLVYLQRSRSSRWKAVICTTSTTRTWWIFVGAATVAYHTVLAQCKGGAGLPRAGHYAGKSASC